MNDLTERQRKLLEFYVDYLVENYCPPTIREAAEFMGIESTNGIISHLHALQEKGYVKNTRYWTSRNWVPCCGTLQWTWDQGEPE